MKWVLPLLLSLSLSSLFASDRKIDKKAFSSIIVATKRIDLPDFPNAFNPALFSTSEGFLLIFRYIPDMEQLWISHIGLVHLDHNFEPLSAGQLLEEDDLLFPSQAEDARIFSHKGRLFVIYNSNVEVVNPSGIQDRRDMFIAELAKEGDLFKLLPAKKIIHPLKYPTQLWQKNWSPFVWEDELFLSYSVNPHEVLSYNFRDEKCQPRYCTSPNIKWKWGTIRGGTPALLVDNEYLAFFHSSLFTISESSCGRYLHHYYMGAYTFANRPPFNVTKISPLPIVTKGFYTSSDREKRVIFPGGFVEEGNALYLAYGKDDAEIWIATIDKAMLKASLVPVAITHNNFDDTSPPRRN